MATSTLGSGTLVLAGTTSGTTTVTATAVAGTTTLTLPAATDTLVGKATTDTLTNKTLTGAAMNGTLGATTPSTASVTTLTTSSTVTHNGGTANGVAYLNGSKVLTTGSELSFDGTNLIVGASATDSGAKARVVFGTSQNGLQIKDSNDTSGASYLIFQNGSNSNFATISRDGTNNSLSIGTVSAITFPATQVASAGANTLDDYEEGTWTPVLQFGTNTQTITADARYTKVGRAVNINLTIAWTAKSGSGRVYITGLPFTSGGSGTIGLIATCAAGSITTTSSLFYNIDPNNTILNLAQQSADIDSANIAASGTIACTGTYFV